VRLKRI